MSPMQMGIFPLPQVTHSKEKREPVEAPFEKRTASIPYEKPLVHVLEFSVDDIISALFLFIRRWSSR